MTGEARGPMAPGRARTIVTLSVMLSTIMQALDTTIANVALPYMQGTLSATQDQVNWVLTSYIVAAAIMTPVTSFLSVRMGRKRFFLMSIVGFTATSVLCGMAQSIEQMVLFRLLQGVFGAPLVPMSQSVMLDSYPRERHGSAMAMWGMGVMIGPILGPTLGGYLTDALSWRWVFYVNVPFGILAFLGLSAFLSESKVQRISFDWMGFATFGIAIGVFQLMLDRGEQVDWFSSAEIVLEATVAALALYLFIAHSATHPKPFIDPGMFRDRNFVCGLMAVFMVGVVLLASLALMTPYLQNVIGEPVISAGLIMAPRGMGTMVAMALVGRIIGKVDPRMIVLVGLAIIAVVMWKMTGYTNMVSGWTVARDGILQGFGLGLVFVPLSTLTFATMPPEHRMAGTALFALLRNLGSSIGISVVIFLLTRNTQVVHADLATHATPFNMALAQGQAAQSWNLLTAAGRMALNNEITRQAAMVAYVNDFMFIVFVCGLAVPFVLMLRRPARAPAGGAPAPAAHMD